MTLSYSIKCRDYWIFGAGYEDYLIKVYCYVKWICGARNYSLFTATPIYPIFHLRKYFLLVVAVSPDSITKGYVFDEVWIRFEFSKCLHKVSLNKGMLKCITFILTPSKLTLTCRHIFLSNVTQTCLSIQTYSVRT